MNERTFHHSHAHRLDDPERVLWLPPGEVVGRIPLKPGDAVADIGAGSGYFTLPIASSVGQSGWVYAVDVQAEMLALIRNKLSTPGAPETVSLVEGDAARTTLPDGSCEVAFMANVWHELDDYPAVLREMSRIVREGGLLAVVDWRHDVPPPPGPPAVHRISLNSVRSTLQENGWSPLDAAHVGKYSFMVVASKSEKSDRT